MSLKKPFRVPICFPVSQDKNIHKNLAKLKYGSKVLIKIKYKIKKAVHGNVRLLYFILNSKFQTQKKHLSKSFPSPVGFWCSGLCLAFFSYSSPFPEFRPVVIATFVALTAAETAQDFNPLPGYVIKLFSSNFFPFTKSIWGYLYPTPKLFILHHLR